MRLSEAIRLGSMVRPQARGGRVPVRARGWRGWLLNEQVVGTCALAAAAEAVGRHRWIEVWDEWSWMHGRRVLCPVTGVIESITIIMFRLNDQHKWTRERIADWVETIEPSEVPNECSEDARALVAVDPGVGLSTD